MGADSAGDPRHLRGGHRLAGGDLRRVLADARRDPDGLLPAPEDQHTSAREIGQIYVPFINWSLLIAVMLLVLGFRSSDNLGGAYGIAVTLAMLIDSVLIFVRDAPAVALAAAAGAGDRRAAVPHRLRVPRVELAQDSRRRLVPAADRRHRVHAADDVEARPRAC